MEFPDYEEFNKEKGRGRERVASLALRAVTAVTLQLQT